MFNKAEVFSVGMINIKKEDADRPEAQGVKL